MLRPLAKEASITVMVVSEDVVAVGDADGVVSDLADIAMASQEVTEAIVAATSNYDIRFGAAVISFRCIKAYLAWANFILRDSDQKHLR